MKEIIGELTRSQIEEEFYDMTEELNEEILAAVVYDIYIKMIANTCTMNTAIKVSRRKSYLVKVHNSHHGSFISMSDPFTGTTGVGESLFYIVDPHNINGDVEQDEIKTILDMLNEAWNNMKN